MRHLSAAAIAIALAGLLAGPSSGDDLQPNQSKAPPKVLAPKVLAPETAPAPFVTILSSWQSETILGKEVRSKANENIGRIVDVVVDHRGRVRAAIVDFGGFLGVGSRKIAIDWNALNFESDERQRDVVIVDLTREQVKAAPEYKGNRAVIVVSSTTLLGPAD